MEEKAEMLRQAHVALRAVEERQKAEESDDPQRGHEAPAQSRVRRRSARAQLRDDQTRTEHHAVKGVGLRAGERLREAGVRRGSLLHQFPSKADLMAAVLERITLIRHHAYQDEMRQAPDDRRRFEILVDVLWEQISRPAGFVRLEIMVAAYSDPELLKRISTDFAPESVARER